MCFNKEDDSNKLAKESGLGLAEGQNGSKEYIVSSDQLVPFIVREFLVGVIGHCKKFDCILVCKAYQVLAAL